MLDKPKVENMRYKIIRKLLNIVHENKGYLRDLVNKAYIVYTN